MNERELSGDARLHAAARQSAPQCTTIIETGIDNPHANTIP